MCYWNRKCCAKVGFDGLFKELGKMKSCCLFMILPQFCSRARWRSSFDSWARALAKLAVTNEFSSFALARRITSVDPKCLIDGKSSLVFGEIWQWTCGDKLLPKPMMTKCMESLPLFFFYQSNLKAKNTNLCVFQASSQEAHLPHKICMCKETVYVFLMCQPCTAM